MTQRFWLLLHALLAIRAEPEREIHIVRVDKESWLQDDKWGQRSRVWPAGWAGDPNV